MKFEYRLQKVSYRRKRIPQHRVLFGFFCFIALIIVWKLFDLSILEGGYWREQLMAQHYTSSELKAQRGNIFLTDRSGNTIQMTDNIDYFTVFVDPKFVPDKPKLISVLAPILYDHLCVAYGVLDVDKQTCMQNLENFTRQDLLPDELGEYVITGSVESGEFLYYVVDPTYPQQVQEVVDAFTTERAYQLIEQRLDSMIQQGIKPLNYIGFTENQEALEKLAVLPYVVIEGNYFIYVRPEAVQNKERDATALFQLLKAYDVPVSLDQIRAMVLPQENRYVKIADSMNARLADRILQEKRSRFDTLQRALGARRQQNTLSTTDEYVLGLGIPLMHGVGLESYQKRYYPHGNFAAHILGYVNQEGRGTYGIEEYYQELLAGRDGKVIGLATPWIGEVGANSFVIEDATDGADIYLTIDPVIQKEIELIAQQMRRAQTADSVAVTVLDPRTGKIRALVNAPDFNPNNISEAYTLMPVGLEQQRLVEDLTFIDVPLYYLSGEQLIQAKVDERNLPGVKKYYFQNRLGPQAFLDKNISLAYEPGSIMKAVTLGIAVDSDTVGLYEFYDDPGSVKVGEFTISNVSENCNGVHTFLHALEFSCNVGMIRIAQKLSKYVFYNYLERMGFGQRTGIELAGEDSGRIPDFNTVPLTQFFNNTYGQGLLATPLQMAVSFASLINGGNVYFPSVVDKMVTADGRVEVNPPRVRTNIFKPTTSEYMRTALESVVTNGGSKKFYKQGFSLGAKTGTAQIAFRGRYQIGAGWTNGSVMGIITTKNPNYVIAVQVRRPRSSVRADQTAGRVFEQVADFLISYDRIEE